MEPMPKKSNLQEATKTNYQTTRAKCGQCGRELRHVPFNLNNIMCRDCYGLDRYRKHTPTTTWTAPEKPVEVVVTDEEAPVA
jgi:late competence protein required for DNA uptake (superfamily II DNA/RNA helicase)